MKAIACVFLTLLSLLLLSPGAVAGPTLVLPVSHAISYSRKLSAEENVLGSHGVLLRGSVSLFSAAAGVTAANKGSSVFIPCSEHLSKLSVSDLVRAPVRGMLVELCDADTHNEQLFSLFFGSSSVPFPVYFLSGAETSTKELHTLLATTTDPVVLSVGQNPRAVVPFANRTMDGHYIFCQLMFKPKEVSKKASTAPRVLVTANYDTFGVAPSMATTGSSSGVAAAAELWRQFSVVTSSLPEDQSPYALSLLLGSTARLNYAGTSAWIAERNDVEMDRYKLVVSIDELFPVSTMKMGKDNAERETADPVLYMHVQDSFMRRADVQHLIELAKTAAAEHDVELKVQPSRTNYQHYDLRFEHEVFANRQLPAVTFSSIRSHSADQVFRDMTVPSEDNAAALRVLQKRVDFIGLFLQRLLQIDLAADKQPVSSSSYYLTGQLRYAARTVRSPVAQQGRPLREFGEGLEKHLRGVVSDLRANKKLAAAAVTSGVMPVGLNSVTFFGPYEEVLKVYVGKPFITEGLVAAVVLAVVGLFGVSEFGIDGLKTAIFG